MKKIKLKNIFIESMSILNSSRNICFCILFLRFLLKERTSFFHQSNTYIVFRILKYICYFKNYNTVIYNLLFYI